jgi:hypothetical protein
MMRIYPNGRPEVKWRCIAAVSGHYSPVAKQCLVRRGEDGLCGNHRKMAAAGKNVFVPPKLRAALDAAKEG